MVKTEIIENYNICDCEYCEIVIITKIVNIANIVNVVNIVNITNIVKTVRIRWKRFLQCVISVEIRR
ncbi:unnamed protein product [Acanthoscelides obtectus]|uniref:Uncharacterized protein n=1 Tax=Acanthoscelides obtectus TaxID=200917 RepID=A0A9P0P1X3_ACAOB|nr:unnamed protein product [Acanthoscelides obtectus]CAK1622660.1 hypothetical protein AOBTE_LOCUS1615 [Acanthoscelides obtectus]